MTHEIVIEAAKLGVGPANRAASVHYPIGESLTLETLAVDPYPSYQRLREEEPVSWVPALGMWMVTRYADVQAILMDDANFSVRSDHSLVLAVFGEQMLSQDGDDHDQAKSIFQPLFRPTMVRDHCEAVIRDCVDTLIVGLPESCDLCEDFGARLPILVMLGLFGMPLSLEPELRRMFSTFEAALSNHDGDAELRKQAIAETENLRALFGQHASHNLDRAGLDDEAFARNLTLVFFGGISTVEALLLNAMRVLLDQPIMMHRARFEAGFVPKFLHETMRWSGPVQSAGRHALLDCTVGDVEIRAGETLQCMLAAANRDLSVFADPNEFDPDRANLRRHLGFAAGGHFCLGSHMAMAEVEIAISRLLVRFSAIQPANALLPSMVGHEFRQPRSLHVTLTGAS
jgi:cytochrome P450